VSGEYKQVVSYLRHEEIRVFLQNEVADFRNDIEVENHVTEQTNSENVLAASLQEI
jgi:hypothetical protein